jgi:hypothetical protein
MKRTVLATLVLLAAVFSVLPASAQTTLVTGTVNDPRGIPYSFASVKAQLVSSTGPLSGQPTVTISSAAQCASAGQGSAPCQIPFPGTAGPVTADVNGKFTLALQDNALVTPAATQWNFSVTESPGVNPPVGFGPQTFSLAITITGASQDVSVALNAVAPLLSRFPGLISFNGPPTGACTAGQLAVDVTTGLLYTCNAGTWTQATLSSGAGPPSGACTGNQVYLDTTSGTLYTCSGATWTPANTGGGSFSYSETGLDQLFTSSTSGTHLTQTAQSTLPGYALLGPIPSTSASNPVFESATASQGTASPATISGSPAAATSVAIVLIKTSSGTQAGTPTGFTAFPGNAGGFDAFYQNLSSTAQINVSSSFTTTGWAASLNFLGGAITSIPHTGAGFASCGNGCISGTLGPLTSGNTVVVFLGWVSGTGVPRDTSCTDNLGNSYLTSVVAGGPSNIATVVCIAQNVVAGTATITARTSLVALWGNASAYELAGTGAYYSGSVGPWVFRPVTPADLSGATGGLGFTKIQAMTKAPGCTASGANSYNSCTDTLTWPVPFADNGYVVNVTCVDPNVNNALQPNSEAATVTVASHSATQVVVTTQTQRTINATCTEIHVIGVHP